MLFLDCFQLATTFEIVSYDSYLAHRMSAQVVIKQIIIQSFVKVSDHLKNMSIW